MTRYPVDSADAAELRALESETGTDDAPVPEKCSECDASRHVELPDGRLARCPRCHPAGRLGRCPEAGCPRRWRDGIDRACGVHADLYAETRGGHRA